MVYHVIFIFCLASIFFLERYSMSLSKTLTSEEKHNRYNRAERHLFLIVAIYMILICGLRAYDLRNYIGHDSNTYYGSYLRTSLLSLSNIINSDSTDLGYTLFEWCLSKMSCSFSILLTISAIIYVGSALLLIYKYSKSKWMSLFIFVGMSLYFFGFSAIRQDIAIGICIVAYMFSQKVQGLKGFIVFSALIWLASTFHASAIIFFPAYFLQKLPYKTSTVFIFVAIAIFTMLFKNQFASLLVHLAAETSDRYESYTSVENASAGILLYLFILATIILRILVAGNTSENAKNDNLVYLMTFMLIIFPAVQSGGAMMRIYYYYYIFVIVYLPNVLESITDYKMKQLGYLLLSGFLIYFYTGISLENLALAPYQFFWQ